MTEKGSNATRVVVAAGAGDPLVDVYVGKRRESLSGGEPMVYVRRTGEQQTYLAEGELDLRGGPVQWLLREIVNIPRESIVSAQLTGASGEVLRLERAGNDFRIVDLAENRRIDSQYTVNNAATVVDRLLFDDVRSAQGLNFAAGAGSFTTRDGLTVTLEMASDPAGGAEASPWLRVVLSLAPEATEDARDLRRGGARSDRRLGLPGLVLRYGAPAGDGGLADQAGRRIVSAGPGYIR